MSAEEDRKAHRDPTSDRAGRKNLTRPGGDKMRIMQVCTITISDDLPIYLNYPSEMTRAELDDFRDIMTIIFRQLERRLAPEPLDPAPPAPPAPEEKP